MSQKTILITGSSGFIGGHLTNKLINEGHRVVGVDIVHPQYFPPTIFFNYDLRSQVLTRNIFREHQFDEVYNLACLMGGMGYIGDHRHDYDIMIGSSQIVANVNECCVDFNVPKIFYSSSACVYNETKQHRINSPALKETDAYPSFPDLVYGWQKLFSEHMTNAIKSKNVEVRVARFHNVFGEYGIYDGGKEKAPAALARKISQAKDGDMIEVWGDGQQQRSFIHVSEALEGVQKLMDSDYSWPLNIGSSQMVSINELASMLIKISGKDLGIKNMPSDKVGVRGRNSDNSLIKSVLGWAPSQPLEVGLRTTYEWIRKQVCKNTIPSVFTPKDSTYDMLVRHANEVLKNIQDENDKQKS